MRPAHHAPLRCVLAALASIAILPSCSHQGPPAVLDPSGEPSQGPPLDLARVADAIDEPGAPALRDALAPERVRAIDAKAPLTAGGRLAEARAALARLEKPRTLGIADIYDGSAEGGWPAVAVVDAIVLLEPLAFGPPGRDASEAAALAVQLYSFARRMGVIMGITFATLKGMMDVPPAAVALFAALRDRTRAPAQAAEARVLRSGGPDVAPTLATLASETEDDGLFERAVRYREEVVRRRGTAGDWLDLSGAYAGALDPTRAQAALGRAGEGGGDLSARRAKVAERIRRAREAAAPAAPGDVEARLRRVQALAALGLGARAETEARALRANAPDDARPVSALARVRLRAFARTGDLGVATEALELLRAAPAGHRDDDYYGDIVGLEGVALMTDLVSRAPPVAALEARLAAMKAAAEGLSPHVEAHARAVHATADLLGSLLASAGAPAASYAAMRRCFEEARPLRARFVAEPDPAKLSVACAWFSPDPRAAFNALSAPLPGADGAQLRNRAALGAMLAVAWGDRGALEALGALRGQAAAAQPEDAALAVLDADAAAARALLGPSAAAWSDVADASFRALARSGGAERERLLNNLAVSLSRAGRDDDARATWKLFFEQVKSPMMLSRLNALSALRDDDAKAAELQALSGPSGGPCAYQLAAWRLVAAGRRKPAAPLDELARQAVAADPSREEIDAPARRRLSRCEGGVGVATKFQASFNWRADSDGEVTFPLVVMTTVEPWLVASAPLAFDEVESLARRGAKASR